jgi:small subunit ribosomal protein S20
LWSPKNRVIKFLRMANHKSALKRIRQNESRKDLNKYVAKTTRNAVKKFRDTTDKKEAVAALPNVASMLDKLAKKNVIHKNKASNLKSKLAKQANKIA